MLKVGKIDEQTLGEWRTAAVRAADPVRLWNGQHDVLPGGSHGHDDARGCADPAVYAERTRCATQTGRRIVDMVHENLTARKIMTRDALVNATRFLKRDRWIDQWNPALIRDRGRAWHRQRRDDGDVRYTGSADPPVVKVNPASPFNMEDF
jgi:dihydroxy-acid dehydratase